MQYKCEVFTAAMNKFLITCIDPEFTNLRFHKSFKRLGFMGKINRYIKNLKILSCRKNKQKNHKKTFEDLEIGIGC